MNKALLKIKIGLILTAVILVCSLIGTGIGFSLPAEKTKIVAAANYNHQGEFSYQGYEVVDSGQPNPVLFPKIIEEMRILFSASGFGDEKPTIKAVLEDRGGNWQKELPIEVTSGHVASFPLNLEAILELGETINEELGVRDTNYLLKIIAEAGTGDEHFTATLEGELNSSTLKWKEEGFNKFERGFPGGNDWRQASFGYEVQLKENELFGPITLERKPDLPGIAAVSPDFSLFTELVESLDIGFNYQFNCDTQINSLEEEIKVELVMAEPERWKKSFTILPSTKKQGNFTLVFPLDIGKLREVAEDIDKKISDRGVKGQEITILAQVHTIAKTDSGIIDEIFEYQLKGKMEEQIAWGVVEKGKEETKGLTLIKEGKITKEITKPNLLSQKLRKSSLIGLWVSFPIFCALAFLYWKRRERPTFLEQELKRNRKKYKELISEVANFPPTKEEEAIIEVPSLEALANISNNSLKPILLKVEPDKQTYWVADDLTRYCYIVK